MTHHSERKSPGLGFLIIVASAAVFYGGAAACVGYGIARHEETVGIKGACEEMITNGWDISLKQCIKDLRP